MSVEAPAHVPAELVREFDFDFQGPLEELFPRIDALRDEGRVLWLEPAFSRRQEALGRSGLWLLTEERDIRGALQTPELFSNAPGVVVEMEDGIRERIRRIVDDIAPRGSCDFVADVALLFPTGVFTNWIGL